ncbi:MAG TPA: putative baseplate assembly protein [Coleofasciculaceae cyanobacterium]
MVNAQSYPQYRSRNEQRRIAIRDRRDPEGRPLLNGIDYLEVASDQKTLVVHFFHPLSGASPGSSPPASPASPAAAAVMPPLQEDNLLITGGTRLRGVQVESVSAFADTLLLRVDRIGDLSTYRLQLVQSPTNLVPPAGFDPQLSQVEFSFWVEQSSEFDCQPPAPPAEKSPPPPPIDYLAKDYASFRRLMLDRLTVTLPEWQERNPSDLGIMLVELLAYAADHLSYYQDAVATEAYLGTARRRVSVRRHARLLDYLMHDGCNARTWVSLRVNQAIDGVKLLGPSRSDNRPGIQLITQTRDSNPVLPADKFEAAIEAGVQVFETLHDLVLYRSCNKMDFYTWDEWQYYLPQGATQATLIDSDQTLHQQLRPGRVLIFDEVRGSQSGEPADADLSHRHAVRLTEVKAAIDPLADPPQPLVEITWALADALPFDLQIANLTPQGQPIRKLSVARGNVVLVDAGRTILSEDITQNAGWTPDRPRPRLKHAPLTQQGQVQDSQNRWVVFDPKAAATLAMHWQMRDAQPAIFLREGAEATWQPQRDLLNSDRFARDFVVETEDDGTTDLRFGDGQLGKKPNADRILLATYRVGNGRLGNVGAGAIAHIQITGRNLEADWAERSLEVEQGISEVRQPLPAQGGAEPESIEQVRLYAPQAFRLQRRAVTEADYADVAQRYPGVQKALATRRWTGSWHTIFITVDRAGGLAIDDSFKQGLLNFLDGYRLAGHDIEIDAPRFVPLDLAMTVQVNPAYFQNAIKQVLLETFSNTRLANGQPGFFNPDRFTFGQPVYLSPLITAAVQIPGVQSVKVTRFQRWGQAAAQELEIGQLSCDRLEIARLDNDPNAPENGRILFELKGGLA